MRNGFRLSFNIKLKVYEKEVEQHVATKNNKTLKNVMRVLIVDDNPINLIVARKMVQNFGAEVTTTDSGKSAIKLVKEKEFDLVLMDIQMPELDGHATTQELRMLNFMKPIITLSHRVFTHKFQHSIM